MISACATPRQTTVPLAVRSMHQRALVEDLERLRRLRKQRQAPRHRRRQELPDRLRGLVGGQQQVVVDDHVGAGRRLLQSRAAPSRSSRVSTIGGSACFFIASGSSVWVRAILTSPGPAGFQPQRLDGLEVEGLVEVDLHVDARERGLNGQGEKRQHSSAIDLSDDMVTSPLRYGSLSRPTSFQPCGTRRKYASAGCAHAACAGSAAATRMRNTVPIACGNKPGAGTIIPPTDRSIYLTSASHENLRHIPPSCSSSSGSRWCGSMTCLARSSRFTSR